MAGRLLSSLLRAGREPDNRAGLVPRLRGEKGERLPPDSVPLLLVPLPTEEAVNACVQGRWEGEEALERRQAAL